MIEDRRHTIRTGFGTFHSPGGIYLDNNATTRVLPEVSRVMAEMLEEGYGNPSSPSFQGAMAAGVVDNARKTVDKAIKAHGKGRIVFTSGGTESNLMAIRGMKSRFGGCLGVSAVEHKSVLGPLQSSSRVIPVLWNGEVCIERLSRMLAEAKGGGFISVMLANNETGIIQPIRVISGICRRYGVGLMVDAVQCMGKHPFPSWLSEACDVFTISAHKFHGPKGVGAVWAASDNYLAFPDWHGSQEGGFRPGTENVPGIAGMAEAICHIGSVDYGSMRRIRDDFENLLSSRLKVQVNGKNANRIGNTSSITFHGLGITSEQAVLLLSSNGVHVSSGAACSSKTERYSHVLSAMGLSNEDIDRTIRFSFSHLNTREQMEKAADMVISTLGPHCA